jgi:hypothetical protein
VNELHLVVGATTTTSGSLGLGIVVLGVGLLMAFGASLSLRSIWGRQRPPEELPRFGPIPAQSKPLRSPAVGDLRTSVRLLLSFDFGCLALAATVLLLMGAVLIFRSFGA